MAAALTGVHRSHPTFATAPVRLDRPAAAAARLSATALASVPPNQAARPTSCSEREMTLFCMELLMDLGVGLSVPDRGRTHTGPVGPGCGHGSHRCPDPGFHRHRARGCGGWSASRPPLAEAPGGAAG